MRNKQQPSLSIMLARCYSNITAGAGWQVTLAQRAGQAMRLANRCLWDVANDSTASNSYSNDSLYCICEARLLCGIANKVLL